MNQLTIIGFTGNDAEVHRTPAGVLITLLSCDQGVVEKRRRPMARPN